MFEQIGGGDAPSSGGGGGGNGLTGLTNILSQIDLPGLLRGVNSFVKLVGVFCPPLSQVIKTYISFILRTDLTITLFFVIDKFFFVYNDSFVSNCIQLLILTMRN